MKIKYPLVIAASTIIAASTLLAGAAYAGLSQPAPVEVGLEDGFGFGRGDQLSARASKNDVEYIGCGIRTSQDGAGGTYQWGFCQAADSAGVQYTCFTEDVGLLDAMKSINSSSYITFSFTEVAPEEYDCLYIGSSTQSFYLDGKKAKKSK